MLHRTVLTGACLSDQTVLLTEKLWGGPPLCWINYHSTFFLTSVHLYIYICVYIIPCSFFHLYPYLFVGKKRIFFCLVMHKSSSAYASYDCGNRFCPLVMMWLLDVWKLSNFHHGHKLFLIYETTIFAPALVEIPSNNYLAEVKCLTDKRHWNHILFLQLKALDSRGFDCFSVRLKLSSDSSHWKTLCAACSCRAGVTEWRNWQVNRGSVRKGCGAV